MMVYSFSLTTQAQEQNVRFNVNAMEQGAIIGNKVGHINVWMMQGIGEKGKDEGADLSQFVEYIQFMQATGSSIPRELFKNPTDSSVLDDYNFEPLNRACRQTIKLGARPMIKFSIPIKFSPGGKEGSFQTNVYPPDDYEVYYKFICALAKNLVEKFGRTEVLKWRFGVLTEFENASWFKARSGDPKESQIAFFKLYDYTVEALIQEIGPTVFVGAHAMACSEGLWDERNLLTHCAKEKNYKNGRIETRICYMAISYYDHAPGRPNKIGLPGVVERLREKANEVGLNLVYGVDEGRVLGSVKGKNKTDLAMRIVGYSWQGALDAKHYKQMVEHDIEYFSSWSYSSSGPYRGYPSVAFHVARLFSQFKNSQVLKINEKKSLAEKVETGAIAGFDSKTKTLRLMAYNFKDDLKYTQPLGVKFSVSIPQFKGQKVEIIENVVDDSVNYFPQWMKDRKKYGIGNECSSWSPDDPALDNPATLSDPEKRKLYQEKLRPVYVKLAQLKPKKSIAKVSQDGSLELSATLAPQGVLFYEILPLR